MTEALEAHLDFESKSAVDLRKSGTAVYAADPTTSIWCAGWAIGEEPVNVWKDGEPLPERLMDHVAGGGTVVAHNAFFEWHLWNYILVPRYGAPPLPIEQMRCTLAQAYALSLPGSLENAAAAVGLDVGKDQDGRRVMLQLARPRRIDDDGTIHWWDTPDKLERLYQYVVQDVIVERLLDKRLLQLMPQEKELWHLDFHINSRGIMVDLPAPLCRPPPKNALL